MTSVKCSPLSIVLINVKVLPLNAASHAAQAVGSQRGGEEVKKHKRQR